MTMYRALRHCVYHDYMCVCVCVWVKDASNRHPPKFVGDYWGVDRGWRPLCAALNFVAARTQRRPYVSVLCYAFWTKLTGARIPSL